MKYTPKQAFRSLDNGTLQLTKPSGISPQRNGRLLASSKDVQADRKEFFVILYEKGR